jgi:hypothetical protein
MWISLINILNLKCVIFNVAILGIRSNWSVTSVTCDSFEYVGTTLGKTSCYCLYSHIGTNMAETKSRLEYVKTTWNELLLVGPN